MFLTIALYFSKLYYIHYHIILKRNKEKYKFSAVPISQIKSSDAERFFDSLITKLVNDGRIDTGTPISWLLVHSLATILQALKCYIHEAFFPFIPSLFWPTLYIQIISTPLVSSSTLSRWKVLLRIHSIVLIFT